MIVRLKCTILKCVSTRMTKIKKKRGDLLEKIAKEFLGRLDYSVETEVKKNRNGA